MKYRLHTIAGGVAMLLLFGCQTDDSVFNEGNKVVNIQPVLQTQPIEASTRTAPGGQGFSEGDIIGVSLAMGARVPEGTGANRPYTYAAAAWTTTGDALYWTDQTAKHTLRAYYPYEKEHDINFALPVNAAGDIDFSGQGAWVAADKAWGKVETTPTDKPISIPMTHRMGQIVITLRPAADITLGEGVSVELLAPMGPLNGYAQKGQFDVMDGTVSIADDQPALLPQQTKMLQGTDGSFYALLLPGHTFKAGKPFARITGADGKKYIYNLALEDPAANLTVAANESVKFTLNVVKSAVSGIGVTAEAWASPTEVEPEGEETVVKDTWLESLTVIECTGGDLLAKLAAAGNPKKIWVKGTVNATDMGGAYNRGLSKYVKDYSVTDLCLDADGAEELPFQYFRESLKLETVRLMKATSVALNTNGNKQSSLFMSCSVLKTVVLANMPTLYFNTFANCTALVNIIAPRTTTLENNTFSWLKDNTVLSKIVLNKAAAMNAGAMGTSQPSDAVIGQLYIFCIDGTNFPTESKFGNKPVSAIHGGYTGSAKDFDGYLNPDNYTNHVPAN